MNFNIVLFEPEKPLNTGNIGRTCVLTNSKLHLIKPFNFSLDDKNVRRAGLDYWKEVDLYLYENFYDFYEKYREHNIYICTTKGKKFYTESIFKEGDCFLFGKESQGLPEEIMDIIKDENKIRIPMINTTTRSLNVANTANIVLYEALRQVGFPNMK
ncbi:RNA methyltransferase [Candidatus Arthromitus sp. SFB-mouse-Japan]|uniref:tRNA (cytidine(34)-2'-O)-methyltransferase n=1 Tax=unclassified Candidatus Neoarthromitus TaxID=2638829 RepID=UPI00021B80F6|nr:MULTISPECIES: tRNA (cytidine(34)-2'-O)-methyltransferase [unclassified Candidatus Arthromitus]EIA23013.1 Putative RNA methylase [Candidatus Arthromitus sp. SFB-3]EIA23634.1 Putative RNA methylase [Candidatus Arthromitus sp. SFB-1]EIA29046.1 Putative RNA methylase [Candidatus Arthromitus sp. SFB-4]EIA29367.1 Putative RNA methylase [Candidatus Arthromitus sp. SFB-co]EIA30081.1 Putative RNA methylase [Candidatus Arthromitus sp. SFB-mouse-SU]